MSSTKTSARVIKAVLCLASQSHALAGAPSSRKFNRKSRHGPSGRIDDPLAHKTLCRAITTWSWSTYSGKSRVRVVFCSDADLPRLHLCRVLSMGTAGKRNGKRFHAGY
jgi:hypothetical protein